MSDLLNMSGAGTMIEIQGKEYAAKPLTIAENETIGEYLRGLRYKEIEDIKKHMPDSPERNEFIKERLAPVGQLDILKYMMTPEGTTHAIWLRLVRCGCEDFKELSDLKAVMSFKDIEQISKAMEDSEPKRKNAARAEKKSK